MASPRELLKPPISAGNPRVTIPRIVNSSGAALKISTRTLPIPSKTLRIMFWKARLPSSPKPFLNPSNSLLALATPTTWSRIFDICCSTTLTVFPSCLPKLREASESMNVSMNDLSIGAGSKSGATIFLALAAKVFLASSPYP